MNVVHFFFSWPSGGTWGNIIASAEWVMIASLAVWCFRDRIGKRLSAWWVKHHGHHLAGELAEHRVQLDARFDAFRAHVTGMLDEHHAEVMQAAEKGRAGTSGAGLARQGGEAGFGTSARDGAAQSLNSQL